MKRFIQTASVLTAMAAGPTQAQETVIISDMDEYDTDIRQYDPSSAATVQEWQSVDDEISREEVADALGDAGWQMNQLEMQLPEAENYKFYTRPLGPGITSYLVVPNMDNGQPMEFLPGTGSTDVHAAGWFGTMSREEIREEIIAGMEAAIDDLCGMRMAPSTIRAQASAFGVVEIEATWTSSEACEKLR